MASPRTTRTRDPFWWIGGGVLLALVTPFAIPGVPRVWLAEWTEVYGDMLVVATLIAAILIDRGASTRNAQIFQRILAAAFAVLLLSNITTWALPDLPPGIYGVTYIYVYLLYYFLLLTAFAVRPDRASAHRSRSWLRLIRPLGTTLLLFGLLTYFVGIPSAHEWEMGPKKVLPSIVIYVVLDAIVLALAWRASAVSPVIGWRRAYGWLALGLGLSLLSDLIDAGMRFEWIPYVEYGAVFDLVWFAPYVPFFFAARAMARMQRTEDESVAAADADAALLRAIGSWRWLAYALALPILHFTLHLSGQLDPLMEPAREAFVLFYVLSMGAVAIVYERLLRSELHRVQKRRFDAEEQLQFSRRLEGIGRLTAGIAHDFNNKLAVIHGYSEFLLEDLPEDDPKHGFARSVYDTSQRAASVVSQLLAFGRKQVRKARLIDCNREIEALAPDLQQVLGSRAPLELELAPDLLAVEVDPGHFEQVLGNLIANARDALGESGRCIVRTAMTADRSSVEISVVDDGVGMDEAARSRAFEPFFTTKEPNSGTGLGLATVFGLVEQNEGSVVIESAVGMGTCVRMRFPARDESVPKPEERRPDVVVVTEVGRVLLVEDEADVRTLVRDGLLRSEYEVVVAADGEDAIRQLDADVAGFDLLVTDVDLPGRSGLSVADHCARTRPAVKVLFISGYGPSKLGAEVLSRSGTAFLQKPFSRLELTAALRTLSTDTSD